MMMMRKHHHDHNHQQHQLGGFRRSRPTSILGRRCLRIFQNRRNLLMLLVFMAIAPPFFFHFRLQRLQQMQLDKCRWLINPPLVCAHGGATANGFPNTRAAYRGSLESKVDCIEIDVSSSSDGTLFALHDRDLQRISGNHTARVGLWSTQEINELNQSPEIRDDEKVLTVEDALMMVSNAVRRVILDAKVGPPSYEKGLAEKIIVAVQRTRCSNCVVWSKSDILVRDIMKLSPSTSVGYIVMKDFSTGAISNLLRIKRAGVVGIPHPLIDEKVVHILHGNGKKIYAWIVDDMISMQNMLSKRVDAIITDHPTMLQQLMEDTRVECLEEGFSLPR